LGVDTLHASAEHPRELVRPLDAAVVATDDEPPAGGRQLFQARHQRRLLNRRRLPFLDALRRFGQAAHQVKGAPLFAARLTTVAEDAPAGALARPGQKAVIASASVD